MVLVMILCLEEVLVIVLCGAEFEKGKEKSEISS